MSWYRPKNNTASPGHHPTLAKLIALLSLLYPAIAVATVHTVGAYAAIAILGCMLALRLFAPPIMAVPVTLLIAAVAAMIGVLLIGAFYPDLGVRFYPVLMNAAMLWAFAFTLLQPPSMVERFARIVEPDLDAAGVRYTYRVTVVWVGFFAINGTIALWTTIFGSWIQWTLYNGAISYLLAGLLFGGEFLVRKHVRLAANR